MRDLAWSRSDAIARLRRDVWRYVTEASVTNNDIPLMAGALLQMPADQVRYLAQLQFILSDPVERLLREMPTLIRRLTTTTETEVEASAERIRGPIRWGETYARRGASGRSLLFVTAPTRRAFDTPENLVLAFALRAIAEFGARTGWHTSTIVGPAQEIRRRVSEATRWHQARSIAALDPAPPPPTVLARVRGGRHRRRYQAALDVVDLYTRFIARLDRAALRDAVERRALLASRDDVLLELECVFDTIRALREQGWQAPPDALLRPPRVFRGRRAGDEVELFYQHAPPALRNGSRYETIQRAHDFAGTGVLRPDLVLRLRRGDTTRWLLFEVKGGTGRGVADYARDAILDLLAYRRDFDAALAGQVGPYAIGYAWGTGPCAKRRERGSPLHPGHAFGCAGAAAAECRMSQRSRPSVLSRPAAVDYRCQRRPAHLVDEAGRVGVGHVVELAGVGDPGQQRVALGVRGHPGDSRALPGSRLGYTCQGVPGSNRTSSSRAVHTGGGPP